MFANIPTWTTERVERLKQHFEAGLTCRQIAAEIGVSRNAVIGKLTRLGLTRGPTNVDLQAPVAKRERAPKSVPRAQYRMLQVVYENGQAMPAIDEPVASEHPCSLLDLSPERCRWPISAPEDSISFCGNASPKGMPYCAGHTRLAYKSGSRQRLARA